QRHAVKDDFFVRHDVRCGLVPVRLEVRALQEMLAKALGPFGLNARDGARVGSGRFDDFPRHDPRWLDFEEGRAGEDMEFAAARSGILMRVAFSALANVR